jgi:hypothetical protein
VNFQHTEGALNHLQARSHVGGLQGYVGKAVDLYSRGDFHDAAGLVGDGKVSL